MEYRPIGEEDEQVILSGVLDPETDDIEKNRLLFSAALYKDADFFVDLAHRVLDELPPQIQFTMLDAIDSYMGWRGTCYRVEELLPKVENFGRTHTEEEYFGLNYLLKAIVEQFETISQHTQSEL